jgi:serine/threonine protein kinase
MSLKSRAITSHLGETFNEMMEQWDQFFPINFWAIVHKLFIGVFLESRFDGLEEERIESAARAAGHHRVDSPKLYDAIETGCSTCLVQELAERGSLLRHIKVSGRLAEPQARHLFSQLICAIGYLDEGHRVAHRDLKAEDVLLDRCLNIWLIDFGHSTTRCRSPIPELLQCSPELNREAGSWSPCRLLLHDRMNRS